MTMLGSAPAELQDAIREFWPETEWENAAAIAHLESGFDAFALNDTTTAGVPCGGALPPAPDGTPITAERSIGYFQINTCNLPADWEWQRLYNARHNAGTAHMLWAERGWNPWFFSARQLGIT